MGKHKGWGIRPNRGAVLARVAVPGAYRDVTRTFRGAEATERAKAWAKAKALKYQLRGKAGRDQPSITRIMAADYLEELERRGRVPTHLSDVKLVLGRLAEDCPDLGTNDAQRQIDGFLAKLADPAREGGRLAPATRNRYLLTIKALCKWAVRRRRILEDPSEAQFMAKVPEYLRPQLTLEELVTLARAIEDPYHLRFALQLYAGLRSAEAHALSWKDIDAGGRIIAVRQGKGGKDRLVPLQDELAAIILGHPASSGDGEIFGDQVRNQHGSQHGRDFRAFLKRHKIEIDQRSPHSLRHSYAGLMTATGTPSLLLASYLGHASSQTTSAYTKLATRYLHPVAKWSRGSISLLAGWAVGSSRIGAH